MPRTPAYLLLAAALATAPVSAQHATGSSSAADRPERQEVFRGETTVLVVEIPVQVLEGGEPVRGLTASDFVVYEGDERREVTGFEVVDLRQEMRPAALTAAARSSTVPAQTFRPPLAGRRNFLLTFDLAFTEPGSLPRAIQGARHLLAEGLHPSDLVGVAFYSDRAGPSLVLHFTPDRRQVEILLDAFEAMLVGERRERPDGGATGGSDPLRLAAGDWTTALVEIGRAAGYQTSDFAEALDATGRVSSGPGGRYADNILSHSAHLMEQAYREQRGAQVGELADGLASLARALRAVPGAKHMVLFSQGYDADLLTAMSNWYAGNAELGSGGGGWILRELNALTEELRRSGWIVHGADVKGIRHPFEEGGGGYREGLFFLAEETGGELIENVNDLAAGLDEVLERTALTYLLTVQVEDVAADGSFHPLRVELTERRRGLRLVHRSGYHAPLAAAERDPVATRAAAATRLLAGEDVDGLELRLAATSLDFSGERARVPVLVEIEEPMLGAAEVYVYAFDDAGSVAGHFARSIGAPVEPADAPPPRGLKLAGELSLPPGEYDLRALVRSPDTGREALRTLRLAIPSHDAGPSLLPPLFVQAPDESWRVAGNGFADASEGEGRYPFTVEGKRIAPAAVPVLAPGETARLLVPGLGLAAPETVLESRVVDAAGGAVAGGRLEVLGRRAPVAGQPDLLVGRFAASDLAPGSYLLEVKLAGTDQIVRAPFRIAG